MCTDSWLLTEGAQMETQVLLPAANCCCHSSHQCYVDSWAGDVKAIPY